MQVPILPVVISNYEEIINLKRRRFGKGTCINTSTGCINKKGTTLCSTILTLFSSTIDFGPL